MESVLYITALVVICLACTTAVLCSKYDDNLIQRVGLSMACIGAATRLAEIESLLEQTNHIRYFLTYGIAVFCLGTAFKVLRRA